VNSTEHDHRRKVQSRQIWAALTPDQRLFYRREYRHLRSFTEHYRFMAAGVINRCIQASTWR
jgi:hypothetical protein